MKMDEHRAALRREGELLAEAAGLVSPDTPVPGCDGWALRDMVRHVGGVHRWATRIVATGRPTNLGEEEQRSVMGTWGDDAGLVDWFRAGHAALLDALAAAPADLECFAFLPAPSPLAFWARRQAHETAIHAADAQRTAGRHPSYDPAFAADGLDELLCGFHARPGNLRAAEPTTLRVTATDVDRCWLVDIGTQTTHTDPAAPADAAADCVVSGPASDLYLLLWNRGGIDRLRVTGDPTVLRRWPASATVTWGRKPDPPA